MFPGAQGEGCEVQGRIIIAGAGIGGLTAALALLQRGFDVTVFEQAPELKEVGAGIQVAANGSRVLIELGLEDRLAPVICEAAAKEVRLWNSGQTWKLFDLGVDSIRRFGAPYWMVHRGDLHRVLLEAVQAIKPDAVVTNTQVTGFAQQGGRVTVQLADGRSATGQGLIGADGVHSRLRSQMFQSPQARFTGLMAWRGLAPMEKLCAELQRPVGTNWIGPGGHVITYPIRGNELLNFVGLVENVTWTRESWTEAGTREECRADFQGWNPLIHEVIEVMGTPFRWALVGRDPLPVWTQGAVTLLGDACHPTLPFLAQGAIMAIEDGLIVARCLEAQPDDIPAALKTYESLRTERTAAIVRGSEANLHRFHNQALADPVTAVEYVEREWQPDKVRMRYDWLFEYDATRLPIPA